MINSLFHKISYTFHFLKKRVHIKINTNSVLEHIIVLELYTLLTILAFHKLFILGIDRVLIGDGGDAYQHVWNFWWVKKAILEGRNVFYTDYLFYPHGTHLYFHSLSLYNSILAFLLNLVLSLDFIVIYNLFILLGFILSGFLSYIIFKKIGANSYFSFALSFAFTFSTFHVHRTLGHLDLATIYLLPLFFYFLLEYTNKITKYNKIKINDGIIKAFTLSLVLFLNFLNSYYFSIFISISIPLFLILDFIKFRNERTKLINLSMFYFSFIFLSFVMIFPFVYSSMINYQSYYLVRSLEDIDKLAANLKDYFTPHQFSLLRYLTNSYFKISLPAIEHIDHAISLPLSLLVTLIATLLVTHKSIKKEIKKLTVNFKILIIILFYFLISLGPVVNGNGWNISSPIYMLYYNFFPFFKLIAVPSRVSILVLFFICMFLAIKNLVSKKYSLLLVAALFIELFPYYYYYEKIYVPDFLYEIKKDETNITILNIPPEFQNSRAMFYQTIHEKKILDGYLSRTPWKTSKKTIIDLRYGIYIKNASLIMNIFTNLHTKYIIIHNTYPRNSPDFIFIEFEEMLKLIPTKKVYEDNYITVFKLF